MASCSSKHCTPIRVAGLLLSLLLLLTASAAAEPVIFKVASVAPKDSPWMDSLRAMNAEIETATEKQVSFQFFPGMVSGDEKDMVRKMRASQLQGAVVTSVGLQMIDSNTLVVQLPLLFQNYEEMDAVRDKMHPKLQDLVSKKGFVILGYADLGYTYIFTQKPVASLADFQNVKMWGWEDEPISKRFFEMAGISQISLALTDVLPGLQRGMINGVYNSPLGLISVQWDKYVSHITGLAVVIGAGGTVVPKAQWAKVSPEHQAKIMEISARHHAKLRGVIRQKNKDAITQLKAQGMKVVPVPPAELERFKGIAAKVREDISAKMFQPGLLQEAEGYLRDHRAGKK